jgi:hypothetical protein
VVQEYAAGMPDLTGTEVDQAFSLARRAVSGGRSALHFAKVVAIGLAVLLGVLIFARRTGGGGTPIFPVIAMVAGLVVVLLAVMVLRRR